MNKVDIRKVLSSLGATTFKDSGDSIMTNCPLAKWQHEGGFDRRPSFGVKEEQGMSVAHCFTCGFKGGMMSLVRRYAYYAVEDELITEDSMKQLLDFIIVAEDEEVEQVPVLTEMPKPPEDILKAIGVWHDYFQMRGIDGVFFDMWKLGYYDLDERVIFPVFVDAEKDPVGIVGRAVNPDSPVKYRNYPAKFRKSLFLYGLWLKAAPQTILLVVEGPMDAITVNRHLIEAGMNDYWCVAILGSEPSVEQIDLLVENAEEVICALDNDASGKRGQKELLEKLSRRVLLSFVVYPDGVKDPDSAGDQIVDMVNNRVSALEYQLAKLLRKGG